MWPKAFHQAIVLLHKDPKKTKQFLKDKRLTQQEKRIIQTYLLFRDNLNEEVLELEGSISDPSLYVDIQTNILLGMASNSLSHFHEAIQYFNKAKKLIAQDDSCPVIKFSVLFFQFITYSNLQALPEMKVLHSEMEQIQKNSGEMEIKKLHALFMCHDYSGNNDAAKEVLQKLEKHYPSMSEGLGIFHLLKSFMFYVKLEDFPECHKILERMKMHRKYNLTENYNFMKLMLNNLTYNKPLYFSDEEFKKLPILYYMLQVIQSLILKNRSLAEQFWTLLREINPSTFKANLTYEGEKCLFSLCLEKHLNAIEHVSQLEEWQKNCAHSGIIEKLNWVFENSDGPINKEDLFEFLFEKQPSTKEDMAKLVRAIHKFREHYQVEIVSKKGTYQRVG